MISPNFPQFPMISPSFPHDFPTETISLTPPGLPWRRIAPGRLQGRRFARGQDR